MRPLDKCCSALASILKATGLQHAAVEAKCLQALGQALSKLEHHGITALKHITFKNDEMRARALDAGVREEWLRDSHSKGHAPSPAKATQ